MWENPTEYREGWNFGPEQESVLTVWEVATAMIKNFGYGELKDVSDPNALHEAALLRIANPASSISDLAKLSIPPVSKSTLNYRLNKLMALQKKLQGTGSDMKPEEGN